MFDLDGPPGLIAKPNWLGWHFHGHFLGTFSAIMLHLFVAKSLER